MYTAIPILTMNGVCMNIRIFVCLYVLWFDTVRTVLDVCAVSRCVMRTDACSNACYCVYWTYVRVVRKYSVRIYVLYMAYTRPSYGLDSWLPKCARVAPLRGQCPEHGWKIGYL